MESTTPHPESPAGPGRPRAFDIEAAIEAGIRVFRDRGFEATSLEALTEAMGISRSSFYAAFGSKHGVLLAALERYSADRLAALETLAGEPDAANRMLRAIAGIENDRHGCLMVNCIAELAPRDPQVTALSARHLDRVEQLFARALANGSPDEPAASQARMLVTLALGTQTLRKAGRSPAEIVAILNEATKRAPGS